MAEEREFDIDEVIETGKFELRVDDKSISMDIGDPFADHVVEGGVVQEGGTIPIRIEIGQPERYAGRIVKATLVPVEDTPKGIMGGMGLGPVVGES